MSFRRVRIEDISTKVISGGTPRRNVEEYWLNGNIPWLKTNQIGVFRIYDTDEHITELGLKESSAKLLSPNTITVAMYGDGVTRGKVSIVSTAMATNQACCNIEVDPYKADYLYVYYSLNQKYDFLRHMSNGGAQQNLNVGLIKDVEIELPSLASQKIISSILSTIDEKIEVNNQINTTLEAMAQALFKQWFIDFEFPNENGEPYKSSGGEMVESELGLIPKGWEVGKLEDIAYITMGQSPSGSSFNEDGVGTVFYQGRTDFGIRFPKVRLFTTEPKRMAKMGDILLSVRAPVGDLNIASEECCIGRGLAALNSINNYNSFLYYLMLELKSQFDVYNGEGTVFGSINKSSLHDIKVKLPKNEIMNDFQRVVGWMDNYIKNNSNQVNCLVSIRDTLLPKLMSGEIRVPIEDN